MEWIDENQLRQSLINELELELDGPETGKRLEALTRLATLQDKGLLARPARGRDVNNHIHTRYSFSPYTPAKAVWLSSQAGLATSGIMDHDSVGGLPEFSEAGRIIGLPTTGGAELRVSFAATSLKGRVINNPDQDTVAYVALHGIPATMITQTAEFLEPVRAARSRRNRLMTVRLSKILEKGGISLDYDRDILPISYFACGGEVTERHLLFAAAGKMLASCGCGRLLLDFLFRESGIPVDSQAASRLCDFDNPYIQYDLLNVLKSHMVAQFYIDADEECPPVAEIARFADTHGIILAYPYLGDVTDSVTKDKKPQAFEDSYLDELFDVIKKNGFQAVTYMPSRNTRDQLLRVRDLCKQYGFFQISGEDINQPRQAFICQALREPGFSHLYDAAWALIGHEKLAAQDLGKGFCSPASQQKWPDLGSRTGWFRDAALAMAENDAGGNKL